MKRIAVLLLCALMALQPLFALAAGEKNKDNLPIGDLAGFDGGWTWFGEDFHYDITNEEACWELLQKPITVLDAEENSPVYPLDAPDGNRVVNQWQGGFINGSQAAVHVLGEDEDGWTLIEGLDYYDRVIRGYVKTSLLKTVTPNEKYGIIIDKLTQRLYMFIDGKLWSDCAVSTGLVDLRLNQPYNETASGEYLIGNWVGGFDSEGMYCAMGIRFNGGDLLHEVPGVPMADGSYSFTKFGSQLGRKASHGCVRVQRTPNDDGLCISWLWENLKRNTKVVIWDDDGRTIPYPDDSTELYYNPNGGTSYHASATCRSVRDKYLPLTGFAYAELDGTYAKLDPCPHCVPAQRKSIIDERNEQWFELAEALNHPMVTGETVAEGASVVVGEDDESAYGEVSIIIK
ncbi:MAG: L,D-transpeptidase [Clostridia bacterium]|nr:L,D-transpeptidase [Clostridia bacterium]